MELGEPAIPLDEQQSWEMEPQRIFGGNDSPPRDFAHALVTISPESLQEAYDVTRNELDEILYALGEEENEKTKKSKKLEYDGGEPLGPLVDSILRLGYEEPE